MENEYREEGSSIVGPKKQKKQSKSSLTSSELNILKDDPSPRPSSICLLDFLKKLLRAFLIDELLS